MKRAVFFLIVGPAIATAVLTQLLAPTTGPVEGARMNISMHPLHISIVCCRHS
jgi:hypothetical protein